MKKRTYKVTRLCKNCRQQNELTIPFGKSVNEYFEIELPFTLPRFKKLPKPHKSPICTKCGCPLFEVIPSIEEVEPK